MSARVVRLLLDAGMTGFGLGPIQRPRNGVEEPFTLRDTRFGRELLRAAVDAGVEYPSPEFYAWINRLEQRDAFQKATAEHENRRHAGRRLPGGTTTAWYQLIVTGKPMLLDSTTVFGRSPLAPDFEGQDRCCAGMGHHVAGPDRLSHVTVNAAEWAGTDLGRSLVQIGRRAGLFNPVPLLFMSARLRALLIRNSVRGWTSEVVNVIGDGSRRPN